MEGYDEFQRFKNFKVMDEKLLDFASNYVCLQLNNPSKNVAVVQFIIMLLFNFVIVHIM